MKKSSKILLIMAAIFIAIGTLLALIGIACGVKPINAIKNGLLDVSYSVERTNEFSPDGRYVIPAGGISEIKLDWTSGDIKVEVYEGQDIILEESSVFDLSNDNYLSYKVSGGVLDISDYPERYGMIFSDDIRRSKDLVIRLPETLTLRSFDFSSVSSDFYAENLIADELGVDMVGGNINLHNVKLRELETNAMDGDITITVSEIAELKASTMSGGISAELTACPRKFSFDTVSGDAELYLPADSQFTLSIDSVSCRPDSEFEGRYVDDEFVVGNGLAEFDIDSVSGKVLIFKTGLPV